MRIDCGTDDFLIEQNRDFHKHLDDRRHRRTNMKNPRNPT